MTKRRTLMDLYHADTLAGMIGEAFPAVAAQYGLRVEGIEDDVNEWHRFWYEVAKQILHTPEPKP